MKNISEVCYNFISQNTGLFDLKKFIVDHSVDFDLLDNYVSKQTCSKNYFQLLQYVYKQSTFIECDTFIQKYTSNINELNEKYDDKEIIVLFPYLDTNKSNFYFTLYFLYLYNFITSNKINYVFSYKRDDNKMNKIDISTLSLTKEPLLVVCDDFLYSGSQLSMTISNLPLICSSDDINIYTCIVGMTNKAVNKFSKEKLIENQKEKLIENQKDEEEAIYCSYNVIFPENILIISKNLKSVLRDKMVEEGIYNDMLSETEQIYNYILLNDMYILENNGNKLYAVGQFSNLYYNLNNTLIYLFFKYPDIISTVLTMCVLEQFPNTYTVSLDKLIAPIQFSVKKYPSDDNRVINKFEITQSLFKNVQDLEEVKQNIKNSKPIDTTKFYWLEKCTDYDFSLDGITFVEANYSRKIQLINNIKNKFNSAQGSLCNDSITTFYKQKAFVNLFKDFSNLIKNFITNGGNRHSNKHKKTNKHKKPNKKIKKTIKKPKKTIKKRKTQQK